MFFNETFLLELVLVLILVLLLVNSSPWSTLFNSFFYLTFIGFLTLSFNATILVGFLWIIDLGLGLILVLMLLYLTRAFYYTNPNLNTILFGTKTIIIFSFLFGLVVFKNSLLVSDLSPTLGLEVWLVNYYDYYLICNNYTISDLSILKFIFINNNLGEFILINFFLFYALFFALFFYFFNTFISFVVNYSSSFFENLALPNKVYFIRLQSFFEQQSAMSSVRIWRKKK